MKRPLSTDTIISLYSFNKKTDFFINEVVGVGGSCIAYKVKYFENENIPHIGILKEYCPAFLDDGNFERNGTALNIPESTKEMFSEGLSEFKKTYKSINEYLSDNLSAANYHTVQIGFYEGNNTAYTLTSCDYGTSYDKVDNENLLSICKTMLSVTKAVELYHNAGFLHLDIKPKNILVLNDVADLVKLFDFDSLTSIDKLRAKEIYGIPMPEDYHVPELESFELRNIGIETDIFEIGAMLFLKVFKKAPKTSDMEYGSKYDLDNNALFAGISPQAKKEFTELLEKTIRISKRNRYKTTQELKNKLKKIISLISEAKPYLIDLPKWQPSKHCIGRKAEIKEIKRRLDEDGYVFVKGIGGLGKSELAKLYAEQYKEEYHTVQFCKFSDNLKSVVATMPINGIDEHNYGNAEELTKEKNKILHLSDDKTLIIVDNFNVTYDDFLRDFLPSNNQSFKVIFTTRCTMAAEYYEEKTYELPKLSTDECKELFFAHLSSSSKSEDELAEELIKFVDYNTLIIVLMAIAIKKSGLSLSEMLTNLEDQKIDSIETKFFHEYDFSSDEVNAYNKIYSHLSAIFSVYGLTKEQKEILKNATLISLNGIGLDEFIKQCGSDNINLTSIEGVIDMGWLNRDSNNIISMHPIISDMFSTNNELNKEESYYKFAEYLEDFCNPDYCHFSIVLNKLACAKHLERRYKFESETKKLVMSIKLGRMYENIYQPLEAKKHLKKALDVAINMSPDEDFTFEGSVVKFKGSYRNVFISYIYSFLGSIEKDFGTKNKAIEYYQKAIYEGKKIENRFYSVIVESLTAIGNCYSENHNNIEAYNAFLEALNYAKRFRLYENISVIANELIYICEEMEWEERKQIYEEVADKYFSFAGQIEHQPGLSEFNDKIKEGDFEGGLYAYEKILSDKREKLGEDSPLYKDFKKYLWGYYAINNQKEQALHLFNESLQFIESTSGRKSMEMAKALANASSILLESADLENSERFAKEAVNICEENNATNEYTYIEAVFSLAGVYLVQGKINAASNLVKNIDFSEFSGTEFLSNIVTSCGMIMCQLSRFDEIEPLCKELLKKNNTSNSDRYLPNIILAIINEQKGNLDEAEYYADKIKECTAFIKTEHIKEEWLVAYYRSVARIKSRRGNQKEAISIISEFIEKFQESDSSSIFLSGAYSDRGLFFFYDGNAQKAAEDYQKCEKILTENNLPIDAFITLYNNIALNYEKAAQHDIAKEYLNKIVSVNPAVLNPTAYYEAIVCGNIGWVDFKLKNFHQASQLLKKAINTLENLGIKNTHDYYRAKNSLGIVYLAQENYSAAFDEYISLRKTYMPDRDINENIAVSSNYGILLSLFKLGKASEAYDFACDDSDRFEAWFGKTSSARVKAILQTGGLFREFGYSDCYDFFFLAEDLIEESQDFNSLNNAKLLNYIGVYLADEEKKYGLAKVYFEDSKELFEKLNATDTEEYQTVLNNIKYVEDLITDDLFHNLAKNIIDESQEDW